MKAGGGVVWIPNKVTFGNSFGVKPNYLGGPSGGVSWLLFSRHYDVLWGIQSV